MSPWNVDLDPVVWVVVVTGIGVLAVRLFIWCGTRTAQKRSARLWAASEMNDAHPQENVVLHDEKGAKHRDSGENS